MRRASHFQDDVAIVADFCGWVLVFWVVLYEDRQHHKDIGYFVDKVMYCLGALGFELCYGLLYLLGEVLCVLLV